MFDHCVIHYSEIGTKAGNRAMFERALAANVRRAVARWARVAVRRETGRLTFPLRDVAEEHLGDALAAVARLPGIASVSPAVCTEPTIEALSEAVVALARRREGSFKIRARRSEKTLPFDSMDINRELGSAVQAATARPVDVHTPDSEYRVEVDSRRGYVHDARLIGPGGLPVGPSGKVISLLSGGIDSPVASYRMMLRGCEVVALHLWNRSYSGDGVREKVLGIGEVLAGPHGPLRLELVPFEEIQQEVVAAAPAKLRMLLYRRAMLRVASALREEHGALATITGDAVGQVASQTLQNLGAVYDAAKPPVLTPLAGMNKDEVVALAKRIGTFEWSVRPGADCCGLLVPKHPATAASAQDLREVETLYDLDALCAAALEHREVHVLECG